MDGLIGKSIACFIAAAALLPIAQNLSGRALALAPYTALNKPPLYLPEVDKVRLITLGFNPVAADILWFSTINYFGKEYRSGGNFKWLNHRCRLIIDLSPKIVERYEFCATLLAWIAKDPNSSNEILSKGINELPKEWRFPYLRSFNYWYFLNEIEKGGADLAHAAKLPGAPPGLASLAARLINADDPQVAVQYLADALQRAKDPASKSALENRLKAAILTRDLKKLNSLVAEQEKKTGNFPESFAELQRAGLLQSVPPEPFGGEYVLDPESKSVKSSSGRKGLELNRETPQTERHK